MYATNQVQLLTGPWYASICANINLAAIDKVT